MDESLRALERRAKQGEPGAQERLDRARARVSETSADVWEEFEAVDSDLDSAQDTFTDEGLKALEAYVAAVFEREPGLSEITIHGYTPGFLDGDLCEHSQSVTIGPEGKDEVPAARARVYEQALGEFEPVLHHKHGTDWQLTIRRKGGGVSYDVRAWNCEF